MRQRGIKYYLQGEVERRERRKLLLAIVASGLAGMLVSLLVACVGAKVEHRMAERRSAVCTTDAECIEHCPADASDCDGGPR